MAALAYASEILVRQMQELVTEKFGDGFRTSGMAHPVYRRLCNIWCDCANHKQCVEFVQIHDVSPDVLSRDRVGGLPMLQEETRPLSLFQTLTRGIGSRKNGITLPRLPTTFP